MAIKFFPDNFESNTLDDYYDNDYDRHQNYFQDSFWPDTPHSYCHSNYNHDYDNQLYEHTNCDPYWEETVEKTYSKGTQINQGDKVRLQSDIISATHRDIANNNTACEQALHFDTCEPEVAIIPTSTPLLFVKPEATSHSIQTFIHSDNHMAQTLYTKDCNDKVEKISRGTRFLKIVYVDQIEDNQANLYISEPPADTILRIRYK